MQDPDSQEDCFWRVTHGTETISNDCTGPQSLRMGKVGFPLDASEFENRTSMSTVQFIHSGSVRPPNEKPLISKVPPIMKYFYVYLLIGKRV